MIYFAGAFLLCLILLVFKKSGSFFKALFTSALGGVGALCAVGAVGYFLPLSIGINVYTIIFSSLFSVPGVILLLLGQTFLF
jgi:hypothetical protein